MTILEHSVSPQEIVPEQKSANGMKKGGGMRRPCFISVAAASLAAMLAWAPNSAAESMAIGGVRAKPTSKVCEKFNPANFPASTNIDNPYLPIEPGARHIWKGSTQEGDERVPHRIVFIVSTMTKVIHGVRALVGWDRDFSGDIPHPLESELIFLAQDKFGNVWHLGQYRETYDEDGEFVGGRVWVSGLRGACAGIFMKARPRLKTRAYSQGFAPPPFFWADFGKVAKVGQSNCVPFGCFKKVVLIDEYDGFEPPGIFQVKYHAPDVGVIRVGFRGNDPEKETLVLVQHERLSPKAMAWVRKEVLKLERRAKTYAETPDMEPL